MITVFNRKELIILLSMKRLYAVEAALDAAGIPYHTKAVTTLGRVGGRGRGNVFQKPDDACEFKIYVHRDDYGLATTAIQSALREM